MSNTSRQSSLRVWALLGAHRGDNNQVLALAEALGIPFEPKMLEFNRPSDLPPASLGATFASLDKASRALVEGDPPDLVISTGRRIVPVVRELRRRSQGRTRSVHLGYPRVSPHHFDLVVPTPEYPVPDAPNVVRIPFALSPKPASVEGSEVEALMRLPSPRRLFVLGGPTLYWELPVDDMVAALRKLIARTADGGSLLVVGSPRTPGPLMAAITAEMGAATIPKLLAPVEGPPSYRALVEAADEIFITADSVAMTADAVSTGKPVGIVPIAKSALGRAIMSVADRLRPGKRLRPRDLRFFWAALEEHGYGGSIDAPKASEPPRLTEEIADRVRRLLEQPRPPAKAGRDNGR